MFSFFNRGVKRIPDCDIIPGLLTSGQALSGVLCLGGTGSGKTSAVGRTMALNLLSHPSDPGFLVPCAVPSEFGRWEDYCRRTGRLPRLKRIAPGAGMTFDFMSYEMSQPYASIESVAALLDMLVQANERDKAGNGENPFWPLLQQKITRLAIAAVFYGTGQCSIQSLYDFVTSLPQSRTQIETAEWQAESYCCKCLTAGQAKGMLKVQDFAMATLYFLKEFPATEGKVKAIGVAMVTNVLLKFLTGPIAAMVRGPSTITPDGILDNGEVHVLDMPILRYGLPARFFQIIYKICAQRSCERRDMAKNPRTVVGWIDEPHHTFIPESDTLFQTTARQSGYASIALSQNLPTLYAAMGGGDAAKQRIDGWIGNHMTRIFCANSCLETNKMASALMGESIHLLMSGNTQTGPYDVWDDVMGGNGLKGSVGWNEHKMPDVPVEEFSKLRKGGAGNNFIVDTYVYQSGQLFPESGDNVWMKMSFSQR